MPPRRPALAALATTLTLTLAAALPARADLVIEGRAAQALQCSALLYLVSDMLFEAGYIDRSDRDAAQSAAVVMLDHVPGTDDQKVQAMGQRFDRIFRTRSLPELMEEFDKTAPWCQKTFL
ncbi:hypothetical protein LHP98_04550 [Rhodobacter sp. Har01]|uniref:hypothetical protein n=1 Tax=Rhodobacter sp. Har01 TaxID=2883999 RepID=UPI001D078E4D|nr:hypothetical protein [Rhodobacter sp. Har01]MCB6177399.1 hypothetical protein [Rhodobacter sp. Har01]